MVNLRHDNKGETHPVIATILLIALTVAAVGIVAAILSTPYPTAPSDVDILTILKDDGPQSDGSLFKHEKRNVWSSADFIIYYKTLDYLIVENYIGVETIQSYDIYHITDEGLLYLWGSCSGSDC